MLEEKNVKRKTIEEIANDYSPYIPGDMEKFTEEIEDAGYNIICIRLIEGYGIYRCDVEYTDDDGDFCKETVFWG